MCTTLAPSHFWEQLLLCSTTVPLFVNVYTTVKLHRSNCRGTRRFLLFGDDQEFMHNLSHLIIESEKSQEGAVLISNFTEAMDLYVSSQVCRSILISAMTSTFAWWLAFFVTDQNAVFYIPDNKPQGDKLPSQELLLESRQLKNSFLPSFWVGIRVAMRDYAHDYIYFNTTVLPRIVLGIGIGLVAGSVLAALIWAFFDIRRKGTGFSSIFKKSGRSSSWSPL